MLDGVRLNNLVVGKLLLDNDTGMYHDFPILHNVHITVIVVLGHVDIHLWVSYIFLIYFQLTKKAIVITCHLLVTKTPFKKRVLDPWCGEFFVHITILGSWFYGIVEQFTSFTR